MKKLIEKILFFIYRKASNFTMTATIISWLASLYRYPKTPPIVSREKEGMPRIAFVCDEMTWQDFKEECNAVFVTPSNWLETFESFKPEIFFCESVWRGIEAAPNSWIMKIRKNPKSLYENRKDLLRILGYCKEKDIKTVFWNKEDPTHFDEYATLSLWFDCIFTTAEECISRYKVFGCKNVQVLSFGVSSRLFYYDDTIKKENTAVFAGSWNAVHVQRCKEMEEIFDFVIAKGIKLIIYNRNSQTNRATALFPEKYKKYLRPKVSFDELGNIYKKCRYAITVNTVTDSNTMFARRVFELMLCGCIVISNESKGLRKLFRNRIWFYGDNFDNSREPEIIQENIKEVLDKHTTSKRMWEILSFINKTTE